MEEKDTATSEANVTVEADEAPVAADQSEEVNRPDEANKPDEVDYASVLTADIEELKATFPELRSMDNISELADPIRFGALRDLGLSAKEAYLASGGRKRSYDNRTHLVSSVPGGARSATDGISRQELDIARDLFEGMSENEIQRLYRKVTK